ncbi:hypothetical protein JCGZ_26543 [Jatropha curcas]|uniref:Uncharacterized protein n=1 Tax=Jatropha curcas TaxID=180498 RepID=A0A067JXY4_JATCU|nr:hypothetical protein JCGZ_26543 [Jatropha curcas]
MDEQSRRAPLSMCATPDFILKDLSHLGCRAEHKDMLDGIGIVDQVAKVYGEPIDPFSQFRGPYTHLAPGPSTSDWLLARLRLEFQSRMSYVSSKGTTHFDISRTLPEEWPEYPTDVPFPCFDYTGLH